MLFPRLRARLFRAACETDGMSSKREIRIYRNRRIYDRAQHRYIKYQDLYQLIDQGIEFNIQEQDSGRDCTDRILLDLLLRRAAAEQPRKNPPVVTEEFLRQLLRLSATFPTRFVAAFLDHTMGTLVPAVGALRVGKS